MTAAEPLELLDGAPLPEPQLIEDEPPEPSALSDWPEPQPIGPDKEAASWNAAQDYARVELAEAAEAERRLAASGLQVLALADIDGTLPPPLLLERIDPEGHTILFGPGGIGKGVLTSSWIVGLVNAGHRVLVVDYERHPGEWRRRVGSLGDTGTLDHVFHVEPSAALWDVVGGLRDAIARTEATVVIVDSIVTACWGADVIDPATVGSYTSALVQLDVPVLSLGHNTKTGDVRYPFGSVFWSNLARMTWSLSREPAGTLLACRKSNNYQRPSKSVVTVDWYNDKPHAVHETSYTESLMDLALGVLTAEPQTLQQIVDAIEDARDEDDGSRVNSRGVRKALTRARNLDRCTYAARKYSL